MGFEFKVGQGPALGLVVELKLGLGLAVGL